jgi:nitrogenase-stabilizing/protective protein
MSILRQLAQLSSAEEFFDALAVPYDPAVVNVARLHILRRMGTYLRADGEHIAALDDAAARAACRAHLSQAYDDFVRSSPIAERVFKVHQDAVKPAVPRAKPFVPLSALTGAGV